MRGANTANLEFFYLKIACVIIKPDARIEPSIPYIVEAHNILLSSQIHVKGLHECFSCFQQKDKL